MTREEFAKFVVPMRSYFPTNNPFTDKYAMELWYDALNDIDYKVICVALKKWVMTNKFPPTIADLRGMAAEVTGNVTPSYGEAWETLRKKIGKFGYMREEEAMEELKGIDEILWKTTKAIGWQKICVSDNQEADRANFRMIYEQEAKRADRENSVKQEVKNAENLLRKIEEHAEQKNLESQEKPQIEERSGKMTEEDVLARLEKARNNLLNREKRA